MLDWMLPVVVAVFVLLVAVCVIIIILVKMFCGKSQQPTPASTRSGGSQTLDRSRRQGNQDGPIVEVMDQIEDLTDHIDNGFNNIKNIIIESRPNGQDSGQYS